MLRDAIESIQGSWEKVPFVQSIFFWFIDELYTYVVCSFHTWRSILLSSCPPSCLLDRAGRSYVDGATRENVRQKQGDLLKGNDKKKLEDF